ncbi:MAG: CTP-dependent riboflavin kinase [Candidatus Bathyarchaeota archaeon]|nr:MAG: CTP-dependent riboflavin kinase [Candidatus Bathyarchaeota archaeon]
MSSFPLIAVLSSRLNINLYLISVAATGEPRLLTDKREWQQIHTLLKLAEMGAHRRIAKVSTEYLAEKLGISQQTASRHLIKLEHKGWIQRTTTPEGSLIRINDKGKRELQKLYSNLRFLIEAAYPPSVIIEGTVFTGLGEGAYYILKEPYRKQFIEKLGFDPYPGTLNLKLTTDYDLKTRTELEAYPAIEIQGFKNEDRTFGLVKCYPAKIANKVKGALIFALRSHYDRSVLEVIAPVYLRKQLKLKDGQKVKVEVFALP